MNIWIFEHYATPPDTPGGTRQFDFARELVNRGHHEGRASWMWVLTYDMKGVMNE